MLSRLFVALIILAFVGSFYTLFRLDVSIQNIDSELYPSAASNNYSSREPTVLLTYANGPKVFFKNQQAITASAVNRGFNIIMNMNRDFIDPEFYQANRHILDQSGGGGFWLWKPYFILRTMENLPDDTLIFYADSGVIFTKPINKLKQLLQTNDIVLVKHSKSTPLAKHLKKEAYTALGITETSPELNSENIWAFFIAVRNTPKTRDFIRSWLKVCQNADSLTNAPLDKDNQHKSFKWHQHDQALLSVLVAKDPAGKKIITKRDMRKEYGVHNFHRHEEQENESPQLLIAGYHPLISNYLWNNAFIKWLRAKYKPLL
jgi:hypothetical protein